MAVDNDKKLISIARLITFKDIILAKIFAVDQVAKEAKNGTAAVQLSTANAVSASIPTAFSVSTSSWTTLTTSVAGRGYSADITANGVTTADFPDVYFDDASIEAASIAGVIAGSTSGKVVLYAKNKPSATLSGTYFIRKGQIK